MTKIIFPLCFLVFVLHSGMAQDPFEFTGDAVLKSGKFLYFKNNLDSIDGAGLFRGSYANAMRFRYKGHSFIFDALDSQPFEIRDQNDATSFYLDPDGIGYMKINGGFGIGTNSPTHWLDLRYTGDKVLHLGGNNGNDLSLDIAGGQGLANIVAGAKVSGDSYSYLGSRGASRIHFNDGEMGFFISDVTTGTLGDTVTWIQSIHLDNGGNVGLGTHTPEDNLHVKKYNNGGNTSVKVENSSPTSGSNTILILKNGGGGDLRMQYVTAGVGTWYQGTDQSDSTKMKFAWNDASFANAPLTLTTAGKVGINTENPESDLAVNGIIEAEKVKVRTAVPDYVFAEDYDLYSLPELEAFIQQHKHLPNIQSEREAAEDRGLVSLGEFNTGILENLETAILHLIEMNKQQQVLQVKNENLQKEVDRLKVIDQNLKEQNRLLQEQNELLRTLLKE